MKKLNHMQGKRLRKIIEQLLLTVCILKKEMVPAYISKYNLNREKQMILLMILNAEKEGWHYIAVKTLSVLLHGITSKHKGVFIV